MAQLPVAPDEAGHIGKGSKHVSLHFLGAALCRAGCYQQAIDCLTQGMKADDGRATTRDWLFLALAYHGLGQTDKARHSFERSNETEAQPVARQFWEDTEAAILHLETEEILK